MDITDARAPETVRTHGRQFRKPARFVMDLGNDVYCLVDADGEALDLIYLK